MKPSKIIKVGLNKQIKLPVMLMELSNIKCYFPLVIDTSVRHNLLDPCFFEEWIDYIPEPAIPDSPIILLRYSVAPPPPHENLGTKRVMCKDGVRRVCQTAKIDFPLVYGEEFSENCSEIFAIDPSMCRFFNFKKQKAAVGVLGADFLKKHKWILDFNS